MLAATPCLLGKGYAEDCAPEESQALNCLAEKESTVTEKFEAFIREMYADCSLQGKLGSLVFRRAMIGYFNMRRQGLLSNKEIICIIDYDQPSTADRLYIINLESRKLLYNTLVAHGKFSGENTAESFSNDPKSQKSSLGFFVTAGTYCGKHGYSLALQGIDTNFNDRAFRRDIVVHGADYVSKDFIKKCGRLGRSWGCPAVPRSMSKNIIDTIKNGCCLFIYYRDQKYLDASKYLDVEGAVSQFLKEFKSE